MQFEYTALGLLALVAVETSILLWKAPRSRSVKPRTNQIYVDTSVLMDGRITGIAATGFITDELVIPRSVILELQLLADKSDHDKRERARFGLDVVAELQALDSVKVTMYDDGKTENGVDERLLELARTRGGAVMTIDYNLNKVASVEHIKILNINELAQGLRMAHLPGEKFSLELVEKGSDSHQAVGYLADGTMVVVEQASSKLGQTLTVECIRSLQTVAGKMLFARLITREQAADKSSKSTGRKKLNTSNNQKAVKPAQKQHSDSDAAKKPTTNKKNNSQKRPKESNNSKQTRPRPKTSKQREASLLRTINNQS